MYYEQKKTSVPGAGTRANMPLPKCHMCKRPSGVLRALGPWMTRGAHTQINRDETEVLVVLNDVMIRGPRHNTAVCLTLCVQSPGVNPSGNPISRKKFHLSKR
jgi:hypothetical protein